VWRYKSYVQNPSGIFVGFASFLSFMVIAVTVTAPVFATGAATGVPGPLFSKELMLVESTLVNNRINLGDQQTFKKIDGQANESLHKYQILAL
jgi:hypothetical protein